MVQYGVFAAFLVIRILSVFVVKTWYVPDEYWQSLEVGHKLTFGYGHLTWEWSKGIRSYVHPLSIAALYRALAWLGLDQVENLVLAPRILQALLSAFSDYCFYRWGECSKWSVFLIVTSWFWFYTATRTLLNTVETCLTTIALSLYPRQYEPDSHKFLWIVALVCFIRPTAAILWFPLCIIHMRKSIHSVAELLIKRYLLIALVVGAIAFGLDSYAYDRFIVTPFEFFKLNVLEEVGSFYGTQPWHWYFIVGLPTILGLVTLPFFFAVVQTLQNREVYPDRFNLLIATLFTLIVYGALPHKEFRFILPLLPICLHITADSMKNWSRDASRITIWIVALLLLISNAIPAVYLSWVHQRGTIDVMLPIERIAREFRDTDGNQAKFLFLMPCHSTPMYSHVHQNVSLRFLTCEPNLNGEKNYIDEADQFYTNPAVWLRSHVPVHPKSAMPTHIILFDKLQPKIGDFLKNYKLIENISHAEYTDNRVGNHVLLYERIADVPPQKKPKEKPNQFNPPKKLDTSTPSTHRDEF
ncbi:GPI mannosyltransferase 3-like [Sitodiplosis mosellana]|uniref:GPI mannosyltransferase 3-like n=1 Tax=Sitodiplosis mosellana TaxID=263140 RepID=UPI002443D3F5|nr:GPI mannosyltransferase 3-like [Sitodiplosis mosellana]XP_055310035.1 GPI mannosyltransferase 3-like [Sitodiplosis mosellana]